MPEALFVTAIAGILDVRTGEMELCSAGHEAPILLRSGAAPCSLTVTADHRYASWRILPIPRTDTAAIG